MAPTSAQKAKAKAAAKGADVRKANAAAARLTAGAPTGHAAAAAAIENEIALAGATGAAVPAALGTPGAVVTAALPAARGTPGQWERLRRLAPRLARLLPRHQQEATITSPPSNER